MRQPTKVCLPGHRSEAKDVYLVLKGKRKYPAHIKGRVDLSYNWNIWVEKYKHW